MKWLADENFDNDIIRGLLRHAAGFNLVRAQDMEGCGPGRHGPARMGDRSRSRPSDPRLVYHDSRHARAIETGRAFAPIVLVPDELPIRLVIEEILLLDACAADSDWAPGVIYLPLG